MWRTMKWKGEGTSYYNKVYLEESHTLHYIDRTVNIYEAIVGVGVS